MKLDPRTKLFLMVVVSTLAIGGGNDGWMKIIHPLICLIPFVLMLCDRQFVPSIKYLFFYAICFGLEQSAITYFHGTFSFLLLAIASIMTKFAPGIMMGAFFISSTSVSEFIAAMYRMHVSEKIVIPLSVIFRFFPTIKEEYQAISDAMKMRDIRLGGEKPLKVIEYKIVPFMISMIKIGDELSAAALTRGLGAPVKRTNICSIGFRFYDYILIGIGILTLLGFFIG